MTLRHRSTFALSAFALFTSLLLLQVASQAQPPADPSKFKKDPPRTGDSLQRVREMRDGKLTVSIGPNVKQNKQDLLIVARSLVYPITDPAYYYAKDLETKDGLRPQIAGTRIQDRIDDFDRWVLKPNAITVRLNTDQVDYIREYGVAVDTALKELNLNAPSTPDFIRVNGGRILAIAAKSGAPVFAGTITELINNPATRPELLLYALHAAEGLLSAYDPNNANDPARMYRHTIQPNELYDLVVALESVVNRSRPYTKPAPPKAPPPLPPAAAAKVDPKGADPKSADPKAGAAKAVAPKAATPAPPAPPPPPAPPAGAGQLDATVTAPITSEQVAVLHFIRRAAIRALAKVRFPVVTVVDGSKSVYPLFTLARVAVADPAIVIPPNADEIGEAIIGLCNCSNYTGVNVDVVAVTIAYGIANFARKKANTPDDHSIPWRGFALRMNAALNDFQKVVANRSTTTKYGAQISSLAQTANSQIFVPIDRTGTPGQQGPAVSEMVSWVQQQKVFQDKSPMSIYSDPKDKIVKPAATRLND